MSIRAKSPTKILDEPRLYVMTILIDTPMNEELLRERMHEFCNSIPSNDYSMNVMYADKKILQISRRNSRL